MKRTKRSFLRLSLFLICMLCMSLFVSAQTQAAEKSYKITYKLNGGVNNKDNPTSYTKSSAKITLKKPTKAGAVFDGWYSDAKFTKKSGSIPKGSTGKKTFYAKWKTNTSASKTYTASYKSIVTGQTQNLPFTYNDNFFAAKGNGFNKDLALASIALSSSIYGSFGNDPSSVNGLMSSMGFKKVKAYNFKTATKDNNDFVAFSVGNKTIEIGGKKRNLVLVVIRGTSQNAEWYSNFNLGSDGKNHKGFYTASQDVMNAVNEYLKQSNKNDNILWVTGHSRGAAVANIVAERFSTENPYRKNITPSNIYGYTFATPSVSSAITNTGAKLFNFCNNGDLVTQIPLAKWGFGRFGNTITVNPAIQASVRNKFNSLTGRAYIGSFDTPASIAALYNWYPDPKKHDTPITMNVSSSFQNQYVLSALGSYIGSSVSTGSVTTSKHQILNAFATLLGNGSVKDRNDAVVLLVKAVLSNEMPLSVVEAFLGKDIVNSLSSGNVSSALSETSLTTAIGKVLMAHSPELYYSWISCL